jgi:PII-like signaling protein
MTHGLKGERVLLRIHVEEQDRHEDQPLYMAILYLLRDRHFAGATVLRGQLGFGPSGRVHRGHALALSEDLPVVIEVVDTEERIASVLPDIDRMVGGGLVTLENVRVIMYRPSVTRAERAEHDVIEITGSWRGPLPPG